MMDNRQNVLAYVRRQSESVDFAHTEIFSAQHIADRLGLGRTTTSQYLNEAVAQKLLCKVNSRPVLFFHREALGRGPLRKDVYESLDELCADLGMSGEKSVFDALVGAGGSLHYNVEQCKAAMSYPGGGLPVLIHGATGTGKSHLARLTCEYGRRKGILAPESNFVSVNCAEYANNPELLLTNLFGHRKGAYTGADRDRKGLIALADGGVLFLDEVHCLRGESQEKLFLFMDQGIYHMTGDNETWYKATVHLIMATTENPENALLKTLLRRIPIITKLPPLAERPLQEKEELIVSLFRNESLRLNREIALSTLAWHSMLDYHFAGNVGQLVNCVRACIANAFLDAGNGESAMLEVHLHNLPDYVLRSDAVRMQAAAASENAMLSLAQMERGNRGTDHLLEMNRAILRLIGAWEEEELTDAHVLSGAQMRLEQYLDDMCLQPQQQTPRHAVRKDLIKGICEGLSRKYALTFRNHDVLNLCRVVNDYVENGAASEALGEKEGQALAACLEACRRAAPQNSPVVEEMIRLLTGGLNIEIGPVGLLDVTVCFSSFAARFDVRRCVGMIMAHGYSTASSMAATANHLLGRHVFEAIDMPMEVKTATIAAQLSRQLAAFSGVKDVVMLVDMGSLEEICARVENADGMNLGVINNVTLKLALHVGERILQDEAVAKILEECTREPLQHECMLVENRKKPNVILSVCATGVATAERIRDLFLRSFPHDVELTVIAHNYGSLRATGERTPVFEKYNVLFIVGTDDPGVSGYPFFSLEDILKQRSTRAINGYLSAYMDEKSLRSFNANLLKQFSLQNLLDHLTILNPEKIVGYVEEIISQLQEGTGKRFASSIVVGLYIHITCMIERLITDRNPVNYEDIETFVHSQGAFIDLAKTCFARVERDYGVAIPASEIAYLYEYVYRMGHSDDGWAV